MSSENLVYGMLAGRQQELVPTSGFQIASTNVTEQLLISPTDNRLIVLTLATVRATAGSNNQVRIYWWNSTTKSYIVGNASNLYQFAQNAGADFGGFGAPLSIAPGSDYGLYCDITISGSVVSVHTSAFSRPRLL